MERFLSLGKTMNLRHMGGYRTGSGRHTRSDRLYRSGFLNLADNADQADFAELGVNTIYDFRSPLERRKNVLQVGKHVEVIELGMLVASVENLWSMLLEEGLTPAGAEKIMGERYRELTEEEIPGYRTMFQHMLDTDGGVLVMCSFGKDRAGIASALILSALGVGDSLVREDYLLSSNAYADKNAAIAQFEQFFNEEGMSVDEEIVLPILDARVPYLERAWQVMLDTSGSREAFMREQLGLDEAARLRLEARFSR